MALVISKSVVNGAGVIPYTAGALHTAVFEHTFTTAFTAASDILELAALPARAKIDTIDLIGEDLGGANNATISTLTGTLGNEDDTRVADVELLGATAVQNAVASVPVTAGVALARSEHNRGIGVELSANVAASSTAKLKMVVRYYA